MWMNPPPPVGPMAEVPPPVGPIVPHLRGLGKDLAACGCHWIKPSVVDIVVDHCKTARGKLQEAAELLEDAEDAFEMLYSVLLDSVAGPLVLDLVGPAATLVDCLVGGPGPLAGAIGIATDALTAAFCYPPQEGVLRPLVAARRNLGSITRILKANWQYSNAIFHTLGLCLDPPGDKVTLRSLDVWIHHIKSPFEDAEDARESLDLAADWSSRSGLAFRQARMEGRSPRETTVHLILQQAIDSVNYVLVDMRVMKRTFRLLDQYVRRARAGH